MASWSVSQGLSAAARWARFDRQWHRLIHADYAGMRRSALPACARGVGPGAIAADVAFRPQISECEALVHRSVVCHDAFDDDAEPLEPSQLERDR